MPKFSIFILTRLSLEALSDEMIGTMVRRAIQGIQEADSNIAYEVTITKLNVSDVVCEFGPGEGDGVGDEVE